MDISHADRQTDRQTFRRQIDRQIDIQIDRQIDRQLDRQIANWIEDRDLNRKQDIIGQKIDRCVSTRKKDLKIIVSSDTEHEVFPLFL